MSPIVFECKQCGTRLFPARYLCPSCGSAQWTEKPAAHGTVIAATVVRHRVATGESTPIHLASVATDAGPIVIARIDADLRAGDPVSLTVDPQQRIVACRPEQAVPAKERQPQ